MIFIGSIIAVLLLALALGLCDRAAAGDEIEMLPTSVPEEIEHLDWMWPR